MVTSKHITTLNLIGHVNRRHISTRYKSKKNLEAKLLNARSHDAWGHYASCPTVKMPLLHILYSILKIFQVHDMNHNSEKCNTNPWLMERNSGDLCGPFIFSVLWRKHCSRVTKTQSHILLKHFKSGWWGKKRQEGGGGVAWAQLKSWLKSYVTTRCWSWLPVCHCIASANLMSISKYNIHNSLVL